MPALFYRPYEAIDDTRLKRVSSTMSLASDIDRWINEGGAIRKWPVIPHGES
jgi:hypothetical protein